MIESFRRVYEDMLTWESWKRHLIAMFAEFVGTTAFLWLAFAGQTFAANPATSVAGNNDVNNPGNILYVALIFGFSYAVNLWIFNSLSGGFFNPAVTFALMILEHITLARGLLLIIMQFIGGIVAAALVLGMFPFPLRARTVLNPAANLAQGVFIEAFLTTFLVFTIIVLTVERTRTYILAPVGIGLALFVAELAGIFFTGGSLNPARSLGPSVVANQYGRYHWIYYVGPLIGLLLAVALYEVMKLAGYRSWASNEGLDYVEKVKTESTESKEASQRNSKPDFENITPQNVGLSLV